MDGPGFANSDPAQAVVRAIEGAAEDNRAAADKIARLVEASRQPIGEDELQDILRRAVCQMNHTLAIRAIQLQRGIVVGAFAAALALIVIGWLAAGWWYSHADITGMSCQDQTGGRVCFVWVTPPTTPANKR